MDSIGDILSKSQKDVLISNVVNKGSVYRMKLTPEEGVIPKKEGDDDRNKYFIVIGFDKNGSAIGFVLINTLIHKSLSLDLQCLQYPVTPQKYPFLKKIRYVDCSEIKSIQRDKFNSLFSAEKEFGQIDDEDMSFIIECVKNSPVVTPKMLKRFGIIE